MKVKNTGVFTDAVSELIDESDLGASRASRAVIHVNDTFDLVAVGKRMSQLEDGVLTYEQFLTGSTIVGLWAVFLWTTVFCRPFSTMA